MGNTTLHDRPVALSLLILLVIALLYVPWLGHTDLVHEETRRAVVARNMVESGDYLVPELAERIYLAKPPVFNWMILAASAPAGEITEFTARLPSVLSLGALALFMAFVVGRHLDTPGRWLLGLSMLFTGELMHKAVLAEIDVFFTLLVTASLWGWFELDERGHRGLALWLPPALLVAAAFLTKREPGLVFYYLAIGGYLLHQRRFLELFRPAHLFAAAVTLALIGSWIGLMVARVGGIGPLLTDLDEEVLDRGISSDAGDYVTHIASYPLEILGAALPFSVLLLPLAWRGVRRAVCERYGRVAIFAIIAVLINLPIYWLRADSAVRYFLPMFPTLLVLCAAVFDVFVARMDQIPEGARRALHGAGLVLIALACIFAAAGLTLSVPGLFPDIAGPLLPAPLMGALCATLLAGGFWLGWHRRRDVVMVVLAGILGFGVLFRLLTMGYVLPHDARELAREDNVPGILSTIRERLPADVETVQALGKMPHAVWFYDRQGLVAPEARMERAGKAVSAYVLVQFPNRKRLEVLDSRVERTQRIPYEDGDFILARVDGPPIRP
jgi:4-amino-4-deoxy-L-arabinose transferase-like glycosyltransferase